MNCKNCQTKIEHNDDFCRNCGGKIVRNRLTIKNLFEHLSEHFLNYDNRFLQTFITLFTKPEDVIDGYITGVRKKYANVVSYFAIALTVSGLQLFILYKFFPETMDMSTYDQQTIGPNSNDVMSIVREYQAVIMMLTVPLYALVSYFVFYTLKKYNYTEHLVIFMYLLSQLTFIGAFTALSAAFLGLSFVYAGLILSPLQIIYSIYVLQKLYKLSAKGLILRTLFFFLILFIAFVIFIIITIMIGYFNGSLMEQIEAQRAAKQELSSLLFLHKLNFV